MRFLSALLVLTILGGSLFAQGRIIIPRPPVDFKPNQVYLKSVDAAVELKQGVGNIILEQTFYNQSPVQLEGEYIFAIPDEAQIHDFHLYINGKKTKGKVLDGKEALKIYENIVRNLRDPALLEYAGYGLFKARVFPILPKSDRKIELSYAQVVSYDSGTYRFTLPIRQSGQGAIKDFHLSINLETEAPIATIYSPSHQVHITRQGEKKARITLETNHMEGGKDFVLYYTLADQEINAAVLTFRPRTDRDGYFMLLAAPRYESAKKKYVPKDIIFVIDVSGSMGGQKIEQARQALHFCINTLNAEDKFEIISFSSSINNFQNSLKSAGKDEIQNARYFIDNLSANGGTNINDALKRALQLKAKQDNRPTSIVFLTDGLPTEGEQEISRILQNIKNEKKEFIRIFSFGVGYDVNTFLLDKLSKDSHGNANYVKPGENIEKEVSSFFAKISSPVLTNPQIDFGQFRVYDVYPQKLPDIFQGQRVTVIGRYRKAGKAHITLTGKQGGKNRLFKYQVTFKKREMDDEFISKLWANRKVSHLLTQIRFNGENPELVESVKNLGKEYGIVTPYTSYLVTEQKKELAEMQNAVISGTAGASAIRLKEAQEVRKNKAVMDEESVGSATFYDAMTQQPRAAAKSSGKGAVMASRAAKKIASADKDMNMIITVQRIGGKTFYLKKGIWVESGLDMKRKPDKILTFLSDDFFKLSRKDARISRILALGEQVVFEWKGKIYKISNK
jgi:Ca-activated chloride channel family protein